MSRFVYNLNFVRSQQWFDELLHKTQRIWVYSMKLGLLALKIDILLIQGFDNPRNDPNEIFESLIFEQFLSFL